MHSGLTERLRAERRDSEARLPLTVAHATLYKLAFVW
jgi:hypothetical protein